VNGVLAGLLAQWRAIEPRVRRVLLALLLAVVVLIIALASSSQGVSTVQPKSQFQAAGADVGQFGLGSGSAGGFGSGSGSGAAAVSAPASHLLVHVVGAVVSPGVYQLEPDARVLDAIFAAGGFLKEADESSINLARPVNDGEQIVVLSAGVGVGGVGGSSGGAFSAGEAGASLLVNVNQADASALDALPGIGPTLAGRIVDYRKLNGGFTKLSDLGKVAGIGKSLLANLQSLVTF
jgi:competence protein ComEA